MKSEIIAAILKRFSTDHPFTSRKIAIFLDELLDSYDITKKPQALTTAGIRVES